MAVAGLEEVLSSNGSKPADCGRESEIRRTIATFGCEDRCLHTVALTGDIGPPAREVGDIKLTAAIGKPV